MKRMRAVVFDCDSTLSAIEGIDELAADHRQAVEELTNAAMAGTLPLEAVYGRRLELIRPHRRQIEALAVQYVERLVPDAAGVVAALQRAGIEVRILSGGLLPPVLAVAQALGIAGEHVLAVNIEFDAAGAYADYDRTSPVARAGGKREVVSLWRRHAAPLMMVGDGATDLETRGVADVFVAYAGVVARPAVMAEADIIVRSASLAPVVPLALGGIRPRHAEDARLYDEGVRLLDEEYRTHIPGSMADRNGND